MINFNDEIFKNLCVVSAPSGAGKSSLIKKVCIEKNISVCISETSRKPRKGEVEGVDYKFIEKEDFQERVKANKYIEYAIVHGNYYGTSIESVTNQVKKDEIVILEIDIQGAEIIKKKIPFSRSIFILPPTLKILEKRLRERATDEESVILERLKNAKTEVTKAPLYDYILVNDDFDNSQSQLTIYINDINTDIAEKIRKEPLIDIDF
jgi:guanylate kinase|tara:strand:- start:3666 stop:4289 length:624 start_codon:yes stop_codon:yes gene_type:complete